MADYVNKPELYRIINQALARCDDHNGAPINKEIADFEQQYHFRFEENGQLRIFEEPNWSQNELKRAREFCDSLERYRQKTNVDLDDNELDLSDYKEIYNGLKAYLPHIYPQNINLARIVLHIAKRHLPEFREQCLLEEYNTRANKIVSLKKKRQREKSTYKDYEMDAQDFFANVFYDEELKKVRECPQKLDLYQNCIKVVDCLPSQQYSRTAKYRLKYSFYRAIKLTAAKMGADYYKIAIKAAEKAEGYVKAIENIKRQMDKKYNIEQRNKRARDEWNYR